MKRTVTMICRALQERPNCLNKCVSFINYMYFTKVIKTLLLDDRKMLFHTFLKCFYCPENVVQIVLL